jgi:type IV pilus assembly protein PilA
VNKVERFLTGFKSQNKSRFRAKKSIVKEEKKMFTKMMRKNEGFTLIELMIVIAIIGILAAIAIPQFSAYRTRSYNSSAESDLRNAATAQEAYYVDHQTYVADPQTNLVGATYGLYTSANVVLDGGAAAQQYTMTSYHTSGNKTFTLTGPGGSVTTS